MLRQLLKYFSIGLFRLLYRVEVKGLENYKRAGKRVLVIVNHVSLLDPPLLACFLPKKPSFVIDLETSQRWWVRLFLPLCKTLPVDPTKPIAIKSVIKELQADNLCIVFPEGRISSTGGLMKIYEGAGVIARKAQATILPIRIDGLQYTPFTHNPVSFFRLPKVTMSILPPVSDLDTVPGKTDGARLYNLMSDMIFKTSTRDDTLFNCLLHARSVHGGKYVVAEDIRRQPTTYNQLIMRSFILGRKLSVGTKKGEFVGVLLPNMVITATTFFALHSHGRVPTMLNFTAGIHNVILACKTASLKKVVTSRTFEQEAKCEDVTRAIRESGVELIYLEDLAMSVSLWDKLYGFFGHFFPYRFYKKRKPDPQDPAVVLFHLGFRKGA